MNMKYIAIFFLVLGCVVFGLYFLNTRPLPPPTLVSPAQPDPWLPNAPVQPSPSAPLPNLPPDINVLEVLKPVFREAQVANKKVFLMLSQEGCVYCERMRRDVLPKVNMTSFAYLETKDRAVVNQYHASAFPTLLILDNTGMILKRHTGYLGVMELKKWIK
jgi:thioredoxin-related protein